MGWMRSAYKIFVGKSVEKREMKCEIMNWRHVSQNRNRQPTFANVIIKNMLP
jgi:hypothetical protein